MKELGYTGNILEDVQWFESLHGVSPTHLSLTTDDWVELMTLPALGYLPAREVYMLYGMVLRHGDRSRLEYHEE